MWLYYKTINCINKEFYGNIFTYVNGNNKFPVYYCHLKLSIFNQNNHKLIQYHHENHFDNTFHLASILVYNCEIMLVVYGLFGICTEDIDGNINKKIGLV